MTYAALLSQEGIYSQYLLVMAPRRVVSDWTLVSGTTYSKSFDYGHVTALKKDDTVLTEATSVAGTTSGKFYFDFEANLLYVNVGSSPASFYMVATYEIYFGTFDAHWYRSPLDTASRQVYYEPLISNSCAILSNLSDSLFGFLPSNSTSIILSNLTQFFNRHVYDSSFNSADFRLYHYLDELTVANIKLVYKGLMNFMEYNDSEVTIKIMDRTNIFGNEYRNAEADDNFFGTATFPNIDPNFKNRPIRTVYGVVDGVIGINYDYSQGNGSGANRYYGLQNGDSNFGVVTGTVPAAPVSTTTRTYLDTLYGIQAGDDVYIDNAAGASGDARVAVTAIGVSSGVTYLDHAAISVAAASGSAFRRGWIGNAYLIKQGAVTRLRLDTDYVERIENGIGAVQLDQTALTTLLGTEATSDDTVFCRVYGKKNNVTLSATPLGSDSSLTGNLTDIIPVFTDILKTFLSESDLDIATIQSLDSTVNDQVGFCIPKVLGDDFPTLRDLVIDLCQTALLRIFINDDGVWSLRQVGPAGSYSKQIEDDEILAQRFGYSFDYQDVISDALVSYARSDINNRNQLASEGSFKTVRAESPVAKRLHGIVKQRTFETYHIVESEAQTLANRLSYYFGDRRGILRLSTKNRFFDTEINDVLRVTRAKLPGFQYDEDTNRSRDFVTNATSKNLTEIDIEVDDQKGIEDNSGSW